MCRGAEVFVCRLSRCQKRGTWKMHFVFVFYVGERKREKTKQMEKGNFKKKQKIMFMSGCEQKMLLSIFRKLGNTICVQKVKNAHFRWHYLFWENGTFLWPCKITKHYKTRGFSRYRAKPKMALLVSNVPFWEGPSKGGFTICNTQKLCSAENTILLCFQQNTALQ